MSDPVLLVEREGAVAVLTLNRPDRRNALNGELVGTLLKRLEDCDRDDEVRAVVLTGAGTSFCSGADLNEIQDPGPEDVLARVEASLAIHSLLPQMATPVIAAVNGPALAGGCGLAMSCDIVVASNDAEFGYPEVTRGLVAALVMVSLERLVGRRAALDLLLSGRRVTAREALALGMLTEVAPAPEVIGRALVRAGQLAQLSPSAVALTKKLFFQIGDLSYPAALNHAKDANLVMRSSSEARDGARAFFERNRKERSDD